MSGTYMTEPEMATKLGWTLDYLKVLLDLARQPVSLSTPVEEDGTELGSRLSVADETATAGEGVDSDRFRTSLRRALSKLDARESAIVCAQFLKIIGRDGESHEQLRQRFHVSRTRIGQIYLRAKEKLQADPELAELGLAFA
jgi:RNA polymerase primary sigma factor